MSRVLNNASVVKNSTRTRVVKAIEELKCCPNLQAGSLAGADPASWIKPGDKPLTFRTTGQQKDVTLVPLNTLFDRRYSVYWQVG